jgi:acetoacetyl-CoA synthetase
MFGGRAALPALQIFNQGGRTVMAGGQTTAAAAPLVEGELLWTPSTDTIEKAQLTRFVAWLARERRLEFADHQALWRWSVTEIEAFWTAIWDYFAVDCDRRFSSVLSGDGMLGSKWFEGSLTNYAEHLLRHEAVTPDRVVFHHSTETRPIATMTWRELGTQVRAVATRLRALGIGPGDRVVSFMPNLPETAVAMMATIAIGAVWSASAPEFGAKTVVERFAQIAPKLIFVADGYSFGNKPFDRRVEAQDIVDKLPSLERIVWLPYLGLENTLHSSAPMMTYGELANGPELPREQFRFERVGSEHPLWILFSSGTTGLPKAIVHSHVGVLLEHLKVMHLHVNLGPDSCLFFYSTTGWVMWNILMSALVTGSAAVLYDGSPVNGGMDMLWTMAEKTGATVFGASPTLVQMMERAGVTPRKTHALDRLQTVLLSGAPCQPETFSWFYDNVKSDLWVTSQSGGTEIASGFIGGDPTAPVYAGEIQTRMLGMAVHAWNDTGQEVIDEVGELVVTRPFPSMPLRFWNDNENKRYYESYFDTFPGVWRHGDFVKINARGGSYVYGRADSTLNRFGVRIGTAEIYRIVEQIPGIAESLVVCCDLPRGRYFMPLFVRLQEGLQISDSLILTIMRRLREEASPRHMPDAIYQVPGVPHTLTGKKMEVPIRKILMGADPRKVASSDAMANPDTLAWYSSFAQRERSHLVA